MARAVLFIVPLLCLLSNAPAQVVQAEGYKVSKVNREFIDAEGNTTDEVGSLVSKAKYQRALERNRKYTGIRFFILWKAPSTPTPNLTVKLEAKGQDAQGRSTAASRFRTYPKKSHFSGWAILDIDGESFARFGELRAWKVTILQDGQPMAERKSFLWDDSEASAGKPAAADKPSATEKKPEATEASKPAEATPPAAK
jgi:hypothetical protein